MASSDVPLAAPDADALIRTREARGVATAMAARIAYFAIAGMTVPATSPGGTDRVVTLIAIAAGLVVAILGLRAARAERHLTLWGCAGAGIEILALLILPWSWYAVVGGNDTVPLAFVAKGDFAFVLLGFLALNSLALRPLYPAIVGIVGVLELILLLILGVADPRSVLTTDPLVAHMAGGLHVAFLLWRILVIAIVAAVFVAITAAFRRSLREAARAAVENARIREEQARLVADARLAGLEGLVSGLLHEINSPLGTLTSGASSSATAARRVEEGLEGIEVSPRVGRMLAALEASARASKDAAARIKQLVAALGSFARIDAADREWTDLAPGLRAAVDLVPSTVRGEVAVEFDLSPVPPVYVRGREIHQVFLTLVENAFEAMQGHGTLQLGLRPSADGIEVTIADTGPGIPDELLPHLFELRLTRRKSRVALGLGLPVAWRTVREHGGDLAVQTSGSGTRFTIRLPENSTANP